MKKRSNLHKIILFISLFILLNWFGGWVKKTVSVSGEYLKNALTLAVNGAETNGTINGISKNEAISIPNNFLASTTYVTREGVTLTKKFRYGDESLASSSPAVHILYSPSDAEVSRLVEDAGYLKYSLIGILPFCFIFAAMLAIILFLDARFKKTLGNS